MLAGREVGPYTYYMGFALTDLARKTFECGANLIDPDAWKETPHASVEQGLAAIDQRGPHCQSLPRLRTELEWLIRQQRACEALSARWLAAIDRQCSVEDDESSTLWLQQNCNLSSSAAYAQLRTAQQLEQLPDTARALRRGDIGSHQVSVICRAVEEAGRTTLDPEGVEGELLEAARHEDPLQLRRHWAQLRYQADQEAGVAAERAARERRWVRFWQTPHDTYRIEGELDPESGAVLKTTFKALLRRRPKDDERTPAQRRADALVEMGRRCLDSGTLPTRGGERPHLTLVAEVSTLRLEPGSPMARLDWGPLVTGETARRIAEDAEIRPVLVNERGDVLYVGRRSRVVTRRQRAALNVRDGHCQTAGCDVPPDECEPHHGRHFVDGGPTDLPNLSLRCTVHHARLHPENARFRGRGPTAGRAP